MIIFAGCEITDCRKFTSRPLVVTADEARANGWRDFCEGLTPAERRLFSPPEADGRLSLSAEGARRRLAPGSAGLRPSVRSLLEAAGDNMRRTFVTPMPVFQRREGDHAWVVEAAKGMPGTNGFVVEVNGYGRFPVEAGHLRAGLGRAHRGGRMSARAACVYATIFFGGAIEPSLAAGWRRTLVEARLADRRTSVASSYDPEAERPDTVTLVHDRLASAIAGPEKKVDPIDAAIRARSARIEALQNAAAAQAASA